MVRAVLVVVALAVGCSSPEPPARVVDRPAPGRSIDQTPSSTTSTSTTVDPTVEVRYRVENRSPDAALGGFAAEVDRVLHDPRGWQQAGFRLVRDDAAPFAVILAEPAEAHELCRPYDVYRRYSCQNGPLVVLNADRWRTATDKWTGDLATYREMLVNHEFGHLLGLHHPDVQCPTPGRPAAVMSQQSTELDGCLPNPWPLPHEIERLARHDLPLAPPYERSG